MLYNAGAVRVRAVVSHIRTGAYRDASTSLSEAAPVPGMPGAKSAGVYFTRVPDAKMILTGGLLTR